MSIMQLPRTDYHWLIMSLTEKRITLQNTISTFVLLSNMGGLAGRSGHFDGNTKN